MLKTKPNRKPNCWGHNVRVDHDKGRIYYTMDNGKEEYWEIPPDSSFVPPDWFVEGCSFEAWTINRSTSRSHTDYDWVYVSPIASRRV